jgi:hypothetical protein
MAESVYESILQSVRQEILALSLPGMADDHVKIVKVYRNLAPSVVPGLPGVLIFPSGVETMTPVTNASDDIGYPVAVAMLADDRADEADETNDGDETALSADKFRDRLLYWRERIRDHFIGQRLANVITVWDCKVEPSVVVDPPEKMVNLWRGALVLRFVSRERRGSSVANITS